MRRLLFILFGLSLSFSAQARYQCDVKNFGNFQLELSFPTNSLNETTVRVMKGTKQRALVRFDQKNIKKVPAETDPATIQAIMKTYTQGSGVKFPDYAVADITRVEQVQYSHLFSKMGDVFLFGVYVTTKHSMPRHDLFVVGFNGRYDVVAFGRCERRI